MSQRGLVDYCFVGIANDLVVGLGSGRADGVPLEDFTAGRIYRYTENGDHSSLINKDWDTLYADITRGGPRSNGQVTMTIAPNPVYATSDGWRYEATITNNSPNRIQLINLSTDRYDRDGNWNGTTQFPYAATNIILWIDSGNNQKLQFYTSPNNKNDFSDQIESVPDVMKACTLFFTLECAEQGNEKLVTASCVGQYKNFVPSPAKTRSLPANRNVTAGINGASTTQIK